MSDADNVRRFAADRAGVYEVWYTTWNDPATGHGFWLRYIVEVPTAGSGGVPPFGEAARGELWFARFDPADPARTFGVHRRFERFTARDRPFRVTIGGRAGGGAGGGEMGHAHAFGDLAGDGHQITWDLRWEPTAKTLPFYGDLLYARGGIPSSTALAPNPGVPLTGTLVVDGDTYTFDRARATQSHVWGTKHALAWVWAHCHEFSGGSEAVFELVAGTLQRGGITLPTLAGVVLREGGETHRLHQLRHLPRNRARWRAGAVTFEARSLDVRIEGTFTSRLEDMVNAPYVDPDGQELWCANTEIADARITVYRRSGLTWREHRVLTSEGRAHYEVGSRERDPGVVARHVHAV